MNAISHLSAVVIVIILINYFYAFIKINCFWSDNTQTRIITNINIINDHNKNSRYVKKNVKHSNFNNTLYFNYT